MKTTTVTLKSFVSSFAIPTLAHAVIAQTGGWLSFKDIAPDVTNHGAAGGFSGWIYYTETHKFWQENRRDILALLGEMAHGLGESGALALVRGFNCLKDSTEEEIGQTLYGSPDDQDDTVANALAWFALEEVCRHYADR
jgi:hypothetical protein